MGIPSYYKKLTNKIKDLVTRVKPDNINSLYFDFNCLVYYCISKTEPFHTYENSTEWENKLIENVVRYTVKIWNEVGGPKNVFICLDGVVPMAKIRQQRLRRFKSIWLTAEEKKLGIRENIPEWDKNSITPGTNFMKRLDLSLHSLCIKRGWRISTTDEPGEGEHKIMKILRTTSEKSIIYGMDADLILLSMLNSKDDIFLMREAEDNQEFYSYFSTNVLKNTLGEIPIIDYVATMSFMGNDFLPHSLTLKIKDEGHSFLLNELNALYKDNKKLVELKDNRYVYNYDGLCWLLKRWSLKEKELLVQKIVNKQKQKSYGNELDILALDKSKNVEKLLLNNNMIENYNSIMMSDTNNIDMCCSEYIRGLQWILDYYTGRDVNMLWYYARYIPPLWSQLYNYLIGTGVDVHLSNGFNNNEKIIPKEQLAMVLPYESWYLIEDEKLKMLPFYLPHYWPKEYLLYFAGRTWMWECEPVIPILTIDKLRSFGECVN